MNIYWKIGIVAFGSAAWGCVWYLLRTNGVVTEDVSVPISALGGVLIGLAVAASA